MSTALPRKIVPLIEKSITDIGDRMLAIHRVGFSHDEFLSMFAPRAHWDMLKEAADIAYTGGTGGEHGAILNGVEVPNFWREPALKFQVHQIDGRAPLRPRNNVLRSDVPTEVLTRLCEWVSTQVEIRFHISRTQALFAWMNTWCASASQIRFVWPTILALASHDDNSKAFGDALRELRPPKSMPTLPPEVRDACRSTAGFIAGAMLLGEQSEFTAPVTVQLSSVLASKREGVLGMLQGSP